MRKEIVRQKVTELENYLKEYRPQDSFRVMYGLPENMWAIQASKKTRQTTLFEFTDMEVDPPSEELNQYCYDYHITFRTTALSEDNLEDTKMVVLNIINSNYPTHKE